MITRFDDYMIHQTSEPVSLPGPSDRNFYDRYWCSGFEREGGFVFEAAFAIYPNRKVMDGHFSVSIGGRQYAFHASRRAPAERGEMQIGPLRIVIEEPMRAVRLVVAPNETGICCDLLFSARSAPHQEPKSVMRDERRLIMETTRFTQVGCWQGFFEVAGARSEVAAEHTAGVRDKSWGVRPVGEPEAGAPGLVTSEPGVYWVWAPILWDDGFSTQFGTFEDREGAPTQLSGHRVPMYARAADVPDGEDTGIVEMSRASHRIEWSPGTRVAARAELQLDAPDGEQMKIELEPMLRFQMLGIGYQHPEWGHGIWKGEEVVAAESWSLDELDLLDYKHIHNHQVCRASCGRRQGVGVLESVVFGRHVPSGFAAMLDGAPER